MTAQRSPRIRARMKRRGRKAVYQKEKSLMLKFVFGLTTNIQICSETAAESMRRMIERLNAIQRTAATDLSCVPVEQFLEEKKMQEKKTGGVS